MKKEEIYKQIKKWRRQAKEQNQGSIKGQEIVFSLKEQKIRVLVYKAKKNAPAYFNLHGGGFVMGQPEDDDLFCDRVNKELGIHVFNIDYPLAPENPFPKDKETVYEYIKYVIDHAQELGVDSKRLIIGGHSAGANIAAAICLMAKERKEFSFLFQLLDYPPLDLALAPEKKFWTEGAINPNIAKVFNTAYRKEEQAKQALCSPLFATDEQLKGLPDTLVMTCEYDSLREEGEAYAKRLMQMGVEVTGKRFLDRYHGFSMLDDEKGRQAMNYMIHYMKRKLVQ
ncbi:esterase [Sporanaerobium hydrogeniformans]|uniref:Esterase n=1 Tax=Sporanaerobium hydrogeniformans TaxID=3072179 RepID=A0AC61DB19_9FIRM|nr:alpha/beta hydrolase [Sporanaerobium hydrogeniformans]PHV69928.1 esterase [Sporanaerobium hydrogeniformans]